MNEARGKPSEVPPWWPTMLLRVLFILAIGAGFVWFSWKYTHSPVVPILAGAVVVVFILWMLMFRWLYGKGHVKPLPSEVLIKAQLVSSAAALGLAAFVFLTGGPTAAWLGGLIAGTAGGVAVWDLRRKQRRAQGASQTSHRSRS